MMHQDEAVATDRLRQALLAFETARDLHLGAHRRLKVLPPAEVEGFWDGPGRRVGETMQAAATDRLFSNRGIQVKHRSGG